MNTRIWDKVQPGVVDPGDLVASLKDGRTDVAPLVVSYYGSRLFVYAENAFHHLSALERETACERAIERAISKIDRYDPDRGSFDAWLRAFVRFEVADVLRSPHREVSGSFDLEWRAEIQADTGSEPDRNAIDSVTSALARLATSDQLIITLRSIEQLDYDAIGRLVGAKADTCRQRHRRALARLAREISDQADEATHTSEQERRDHD